MPITFSVTCDTDEELARFLQNIQLEASAKAVGAKAKQTAPAKAMTATTETASPEKKATRRGRPATKAAKPKAKTATAKTASTRGKKSAAKSTTAGAKKPVVRAKSAGKTKAERPGRKPSVLGPVIQSALQEVMNRKKPFRTREVIELVMKKAPSLNESSVTTGVSKFLSTASLKSETIRDAVGRPYKLYTP